MLKKLKRNKFRFKVNVTIFISSLILIIGGFIVSFSSVNIFTGAIIQSHLVRQQNVRIGLLMIIPGSLLLIINIYVVVSTLLEKLQPRDAYQDTFHDVLDGIDN